MIELKDVEMKLAGFALKNINLRLRQGEYFIILGPTGAGKTLLLETIAGIRAIARGDIAIRGRSVVSIPPERRGVGIVYQDQALFSHLSVRENILFGLRVSKTRTYRKAETLEWLCSLLDIDCLLERNPDTLSGGERQKVALARALAVRPDILLLDEPLSSLDPESREKLQEELGCIHSELGLTTVHVTHDFEEAMTLGHRIAVLNQGSIYQVGSRDDIFLRPESSFVARYTLGRNIFKGRLIPTRNGRATFDMEGWQIEVFSRDTEADYACIRPESISISHIRPAGGINTFCGTISAVLNRGTYSVIKVNLPPEIFCYVLRPDLHGFKEKQVAWLKFEPQSVHVFKDSSD